MHRRRKGDRAPTRMPQSNRVTRYRVIGFNGSNEIQKEQTTAVTILRDCLAACYAKDGLRVEVQVIEPLP